MTSKLQSLKKLVPTKLKNMTPLEQELLSACVDGRSASGTSSKLSKKSNVIRGEFLSWLCGDKEVSKLVHHYGIDVDHASIEGEINLVGAIIEFPLRLKKSVFLHKVTMHGARIVNLDFRGSHLKDVLDLEFIKTSGSLFFQDGFISDVRVNLIGAEVYGNLSCWGGEFHAGKLQENSPDETSYTLNAALASVRGNVFLDKSKHLDGEVCFAEAEVRGSLDCDGGEFENRQGNSINLERARITGSIFLRGKNKKSISSLGTVRLYETFVGGALEFGNGTFERSAPDALAIDARGLTVNGNIQFEDKVHVKGGVSFFGATIGQGIYCVNSTFQNPKGNSLDLEKAKIAKILMFSDRCVSEGTVRLQETAIGGSLSCEDCTFDSKEQYFAIIADGLVTGGVVNMRKKFKALGGVSLYAARIGNELDCSGATFGSSENSSCFVGEEMSVEGNFKWKRSSDAEPVKTVGYVSFRNATVRSFIVDKESFPQEGKLDIDGFVYESFDIEPKYDDYYWRSPYSKIRLADLSDWTSLLPSYQKSLQPYTQLIKVLSSSGHDKEAREIAIKREQQRSKHLSKFFSYLRDSTWGLFVDYGYNPWKALIFMLAFIVLGAFVFGYAFNHGIMSLTKTDLPSGRDPIFSPITYSMDVFLPIVDLHQEDHWTPSIDKVKCRSPKDKCWQESVFAMNYMWVQIGFGWLLTTFFVTALTGVIRTDVDK